MFLLQRPNRATLARLLTTHSADPFSYGAVGGTQGRPAAGYQVDHNRIRLGKGVDQFRAAKGAIDDWKMFDLPWIELFSTPPTIEVGQTVAVLVRHLGFWSVNISRIVYVVNEQSRYGFAYGTLACHSEQGEERFLVEHNKATDEVWYDLYAFSKPKHPLARIGFPIARHLQKRFARESLAAMKRAADSGVR